VDIDLARRVLLGATAPLCALFAALGLYATLACPALDRFSSDWFVLVGLPLAVLASCGVVIYGAATNRRRLCVLALLAAVVAMTGWIRLAAYGPVF
jgi:hypothetical protein